MRALSIFLLGLAVGAGGMMLAPRGGVEPVAALASPSGNGDCDGDGKIGLSDVILLLKHIFVPGSPAPEPIACRLPATGQTKCYDDTGEADCWDGWFPGPGEGTDGFYQAGCSAEDRFVDHGNGTVTDRCTGLMWQKWTADTNDNGMVDEGDRVPWQQAIRHCENSDFAGYTDWRLPNVRELQSIVDYGRWNPAIGPRLSAVSHRYWSSSTYVASPVSRGTSASAAAMCSPAVRTSAAMSARCGADHDLAII